MSDRAAGSGCPAGPVSGPPGGARMADDGGGSGNDDVGGNGCKSAVDMLLPVPVRASSVPAAVATMSEAEVVLYRTGLPVWLLVELPFPLAPLKAETAVPPSDDDTTADVARTGSGGGGGGVRYPRRSSRARRGVPFSR